MKYWTSHGKDTSQDKLKNKVCELPSKELGEGFDMWTEVEDGLGLCALGRDLLLGKGAIVVVQGDARVDMNVDHPIK